MSVGTILRWALMLLAVVGVIRVTRDEFGLSLDDFLDTVVKLADNLVDPLREAFGPYVTDAFDWLAEHVGWHLTLQYHWIYAYGLMQLFFGSYLSAKQGWEWTRRVASFVFALVFGVLAGTVHLAHISVFIYPIAGFALFVAFNRALDAVDQGSWWTAFRARGLWSLLFGIAAFVAAAAVPLNLTFFPGMFKSFGLVALLAVVFLFGLYLALFGFPGRGDETHADKPGTQMGFGILAVLFLAATAVFASRFHDQSILARAKTVPVAEPAGFRDCQEDYCPLLQMIPAGTFDMGSDDAESAFAKSLGMPDEWIKREKRRHKVAVQSFALSVTEVTRAQFEAFVNERHYRPEGFCYAYERNKLEYGGQRTWMNPGFRQERDHPAVCLTWWDAKAYVDFLTRKTGHKYRLPSEAEWEYAARAKSTTSRYWGQGNAEACAYENVFGRATAAALRLDPAQAFPCDDGYVYTAPVGKFRPNAFGLYDMLGNAVEWTEDCWNETYGENYNLALSNGSARLTGDCSIRVVRGGSWLGIPGFVRSAGRNGDFASDRDSGIGIRVARTD